MNRSMLIFLFASFRKLLAIVGGFYDHFICSALFKGNGVVHGTYRTNGVPYVMVSLGGKLTIGKNFAMNNGIKGNPIGCYDRCTFWVGKGAVLRIGDNVGMSQAALVAIADIVIGNNVKIGGGTSIFTSDFHALDPKIRASSEDLLHRKCAPVIIEDNAFIGARSMILKGVTIGKNSIVGAGSIVTKSVPENEIWAGNPARFVRKIYRK
jgi:transferase hexapeptide repeat containing protein